MIAGLKANAVTPASKIAAVIVALPTAPIASTFAQMPSSCILSPSLINTPRAGYSPSRQGVISPANLE